MAGGEAQVYNEANGEILADIFGHTKTVAIQRAREWRKEYMKDIKTNE